MVGASRRRLIGSLVLALVLLIAGTVGYVLIEKWTVTDALYMTIITVATVGYGEVRQLSPAGRIFTIFVIIFGVGNVAYLVGLFSRAMVEGSLERIMGRRKLEKQINQLSDHYVICGYGRIGRSIVKELAAGHVPVVIIESDPAIIQRIGEDGFLYVAGEATDDLNLLAAGIKRARGLVSVVSSDADNVFIVLTARAMREELFIVTRASEERSVAKLERAGADKVISPYHIGARKMAQAILRPNVTDFIESTVHGQSGLGLAMEEILVTPRSSLKDVTLRDSNIRRDLDLMIIAIKTADGRMIFSPSADESVRVGDVLIVVGKQENVERLIKLLGADVTPYAPKA